MPSDKELLALAKKHGALNAGDWRGLILWQHGQGTGLLGFARELLATSTDDSALLDHIQRTGSTVELLPGNRFRIGGLHAAVSTDLRAAIRIAVGADGVAIPLKGEK